MPTPSSGTISIQQINAEFGRGNNLNAYRGTTWFTPQGGSGTFPSGAISMSDFYNKQPNSPTFSFTIGSNQTNANLRTLAVNAGWNESSQLVATINSGVIISSNSTGTAALTVSGSFPGGVRVNNNGVIVGMGGAGGNAGSGGRYSAPGLNLPGGAGGTALSTSVALTFNNAGTIAGGGGGGGSGQTRWIVDEYNNHFFCGGGGGGGGRSSNAANSAAGAGGTSTPWFGAFNGGNGGAGTYSAAGGGGSGTSNNSVQLTSGNGGSGGGWGSAGNGGGTGSFGSAYAAGSGGAAGAAVSGNSNITWVATGTRIGPIA